MNIKELIEQLEKAPNFAENPPVEVMFRDNDHWKNIAVKEVGVKTADSKEQAVFLIVEHQCYSVAETVDRYFWNGKLLDDMDADELKTALILMLDQRPVMKLEASAPAEKVATAKPEVKA